jgi:hypothetical protein
MNGTCLRILVFGLVLRIMPAAGADDSFTGIWKQDASASDVGCPNASKRLIIKIGQDSNLLTVIEVSRVEQGKVVSQWNYTLEVGERSRRTITFRSPTRREIWSLSEGGSELVMERIIPGCEGFVRLNFRRSVVVKETR